MISSPGVTTCDASATRDQPISDTCSRPCTPPPRSTNAPKSRTETTRPVEHGAGTTDCGGPRRPAPVLLLEQRAARHDQIPAAVPVLDDPERVDASDVDCRILGADGVDLRERAERALCADAHLVAALDHALDLAFDGQAGAGTRLRAGDRWRRRERACARASGLRRSTPPSPGCGRRRQPRDRRPHPSARRLR